jgi:hypothetical protein
LKMPNWRLRRLGMSFLPPPGIKTHYDCQLPDTPGSAVHATASKIRRTMNQASGM